MTTLQWTLARDANKTDILFPLVGTKLDCPGTTICQQLEFIYQMTK